MDGLLILSGMLALAVTAAAWRLVHQLKRRQIVSSAMWSLHSVLLLAVFFVSLLVYSNLHTYQRLTHEAVVADVYIRQLAPRRYQVSMAYSAADQDQHYYELTGDQWQLDARILKWKGWANLIGLDSYYQLDRLTGRFSDSTQARSTLPAVHDLRPQSSGLDIWKLKQLLREKAGFVDTVFGQGVYMPMSDGAHYRVFIGQQGLITRPVNEAAKQAGLL